MILTRNKCVLSILAVFSAIVLGGMPAEAADTVGIIESQNILFQHPRFDEATRILLYVSRTLEGDQQAMIQEEKDPATKQMLEKYSSLILGFAELDSQITTERDPAKKLQLTEQRQEKLDEFDKYLMEPIVKECQTALRMVMIKKSMTVVMERSVVYFGGTDITDEVIQQVKSAAALGN